jgi:hypothetical protein
MKTRDECPGPTSTKTGFGLPVPHFCDGTNARSKQTKRLRDRLSRFLCVAGGLLSLAMLTEQAVLADDWGLPTDSTYRSDNGRYEFTVHILNQLKGGSVGILRRKEGDGWERLWERPLANGVCPVTAMVMDSGEFVVTFDEHYSVGINPVVIYGKGGMLIRKLSLADLKLEKHPKIMMSVSSYWWNRDAIMVFGPPAGNGQQGWQTALADTLFVRLYWGEVISIDLASGRVRDAAWWAERVGTDSNLLRLGSKKYLDATWLRLARLYLRKDNFGLQSATDKGVLGILLAGQLRLREAAPLLREIAAEDQFSHWSAPHLKGGAFGNLQALAAAALKEIEKP